MSFVNRVLVYLIFVMAGLALAGSVCAPGRIELNEAEFPMEEAHAATSLQATVHRKSTLVLPGNFSISNVRDPAGFAKQQVKPSGCVRFSLPNGLNAPLRC